MTLSSSLILIGECGRAHGLKGEVRIKSHAAHPMDIGSYGPLRDESGRTLVITHLRPSPGEADMLIARVQGVTSRSEAESLNRLKLYIERSQLAPPDEGEFLVADLIGMKAETLQGASLGMVVQVPNYGAGDLLEIKPPKGPSLLVPFTQNHVPVVDVAGRRVVVDVPDMVE